MTDKVDWRRRTIEHILKNVRVEDRLKAIMLMDDVKTTLYRNQTRNKGFDKIDLEYIYRTTYMAVAGKYNNEPKDASDWVKEGKL